MLPAAAELSVLYKTPQKRNPSTSDQAIWEAISQELGVILLYRWKCKSAWRTEQTECTAGPKNRAKLFIFFFHFFLHMSCSSKPYLKRAPSNAIWKSENPFTDTLHFCSSCKSHMSGVSLNTSVFVTKHYYILCEVQADFLYVIISTSDSKLL